MTDKVTHYDYYYKAIPRTAFDKRAVKKLYIELGLYLQNRASNRRVTWMKRDTSLKPNILSQT